MDSNALLKPMRRRRRISSAEGVSTRYVSYPIIVYFD